MAREEELSFVVPDQAGRAMRMLVPGVLLNFGSSSH